MTAIATIIGRLTRDPETTSVPRDGEELTKTTFSVAVDDSFGKDSTTSFFDFVAWNGLGTNLAKYQGKGDQIAVVARPKQSRWQKDGQNRQKVEFIAEKIEFLGSRSDRNEVPAAVQAESAPAPSAEGKALGEALQQGAEQLIAQRAAEAPAVEVEVQAQPAQDELEIPF